jgi:hypothetical protein
VNKSPHGVGREEACGPKYNENDGKCPKHDGLSRENTPWGQKLAMVKILVRRI